MVLAAGPFGAESAEVSLFVRRVRDLLTRSALTCARSASVAAAARLMARHGATAIVVVDDDSAPVGIVTHLDFATRVVAADRSSATPVSAVMSSPVAWIESSALAFDALLEMTRRNVHHLAVQDGGRLLGVVSSHDLIRLHTTHPVALARAIDAQESLDDLATVAPRLHAVVQWLVGTGARAFDVGRLVAELKDRLVRRTITLTEAALEADGRGPAPVPYSWFAAGSEGRREQTLTSDQDNGLLYEDPPPELRESAARYFAALTGGVGSTLARLGFRLCDGGFMASNRRWCQPLATWRQYFRSWMETPHPTPLLHACLYFDLRPVAGDERLARELWGWVCARAPSQTPFLRYMARMAVDRRVPLGLFGGFVVDRSGANRGRLDIKACGVFPVVQATRVHALSLGLRETNTVHRLARVADRGLLASRHAQEVLEAYEVVNRIRLTHQLACLDAGVGPDNFVDPRMLGRADRLLLRDAFRTFRTLQQDLAVRFQTNVIG